MSHACDSCEDLRIETCRNEPDGVRYLGVGSADVIHERFWEQITRITNLRTHACVGVDNKVDAIGGWNRDDEKHEDSIEALDLSVPQSSWTILPSRMMPRLCSCR